MAAEEQEEEQEVQYHDHKTVIADGPEFALPSRLDRLNKLMERYHLVADELEHYRDYMHHQLQRAHLRSTSSLENVDDTTMELYENELEELMHHIRMEQLKEDAWQEGQRQRQQLRQKEATVITEVKESSECTPFDKYKILMKLGSGAMGTVFKALDTETQTLVAIKIIDVNDEHQANSHLKEIEFLKASRSCNFITDVIAVLLFQKELWIVMELCLAALDQCQLCSVPLGRLPALPEELVVAITRQVVNGLHYLHTRKQIHRDIKPGNLLVTEEGRVKLGDFGLSAVLANTLALRKTKTGTPFYMAPEVLQGKGYNGKADIWSLGVTMYVLLTGAAPWTYPNGRYMNVHDAMCQIPALPAPQLPLRQHPTRWSFTLRDFLSKCLEKDPKKRWSSAQLLRHKLLCCRGQMLREESHSQYKDSYMGDRELEYVAAFSPDIKASEAKEHMQVVQQFVKEKVSPKLRVRDGERVELDDAQRARIKAKKRGALVFAADYWDQLYQHKEMQSVEVEEYAAKARKAYEDALHKQLQQQQQQQQQHQRLRLQQWQHQPGGGFGGRDVANVLSGKFGMLFGSNSMTVEEDGDDDAYGDGEESEWAKPVSGLEDLKKSLQSDAGAMEMMQSE